ncbi:hypothetical protein [Aeromicrobium sp. UC242_57]|uniref:hypothetical protein n=1 Tax=Aeromicrobium sp. UC242_57 TaxID=3374624 RepID=UPI0037B854D9
MTTPSTSDRSAANRPSAATVARGATAAFDTMAAATSGGSGTVTVIAASSAGTRPASSTKVVVSSASRPAASRGKGRRASPTRPMRSGRRATSAVSRRGR